LYLSLLIALIPKMARIREGRKITTKKSVPVLSIEAILYFPVTA